MTRQGAGRHALVFGASGFLGKWLIVELASQGVRVTAAVRSAESGDRLNAWLGGRGLAAGVPTVVVDFDRDDLGLAADATLLHDVSEIHNLAGAYRFGMSADEARTGNVVTAQRIVMWAAQRRRASIASCTCRATASAATDRSRRPRSGRPSMPGSGRTRRRRSRPISSSRRPRRAEGVPFTIVNPSTVTGVSSTGESDQQVGLASSVRDLWHGKLAALPGNGATFVPVVPVDHLARFMALVPTVPEADGQSYWVLDDDTPGLPDLLAAIGRHYQVRVPRLRIPVGLVKRLPSDPDQGGPGDAQLHVDGSLSDGVGSRAGRRARAATCPRRCRRS